MKEPMNPSLQAAQNPATAPEQLRRLASHSEAAVRQAVAANPNAPEDVLVRLAAHFPQDVLANPVLDLLMVVNPNFLAEMPEYARNQLLGHPKASEGFARWAVKNGDVSALLSVLRNPNMPLGLIEPLQKHQVFPVAEAAQMHVSLEASPLPNALWWTDAPADTFELRGLVMSGLMPAWLAPRLVREPDTLLRQSLAESPYSTEEVLEALLFDEDEEVRKAARANPKQAAKSLALLEWLEGREGLRLRDSGLEKDVDLTPKPEPLSPSSTPQDLPPLDLLARGHIWMRQLVARHRDCSVDLLERFVTDDDWRVRAAAAQNPKLAVGFLETLARDLDRDVRLAVAARGDIPAKVLERLCADEHPDVREAALVNPRASEGLLDLLQRLQQNDMTLSSSDLERLSQFGNWTGQMVAAHPNVPLTVLQRLAVEGDWNTRIAVARNPQTLPSLLAQMATDHDPEIRQAVAAHLRVPAESLEALATDDQPEVRVRVATSWHTPAALLHKLAHDEHWKVRQAVAANPNIAAELLITLAADPDRDVRQAVADNPNVPEVALELLFVGWFESVGLTLSRKELYCRLMAREASVSADWLSLLSERDEWGRRLAAQHPNTPDFSLWKLAADEDWRVRAALSSNPALSPDLLFKLAQDSDGDVRRGVVAHPQVSDLALDRLATDEQPDIRQQVAKHPSASSFALGFLLGDEDESVRQEASQNPHTPPELKARFARAESADPGLEIEFLESLVVSNVYSRTLAARNPSTPPDLLCQLARDSDWRVRIALAANSSLSDVEIQALASDTDHEVRQTLAKNPKVGQEVLSRLLSDLDENTRLNALRHPELDRRTLETHRARLLVSASRSRYPLNRALALSCAELPLQELLKVRHRTHPEWLVRYALTQNPNTPDAVLEALEQDGNRRVADGARGKRKEGRKGAEQ